MADITGTSGNDVLNDTGGADNLFGLDGDDTLTASFGNDVLMGGNGVDILIDSWGDDQLIGGEGNDQITSSHGNDVLRGDGGNDLLDDSHGDDQLFGGDGDDILTDSFGTNVLDGGTGADSMTGGFGNDTYVIDNLGDNIIETLGGIDSVQINRMVDLNFGMFAQVEHAVLTGTAAINATGNASDNSLTGNTGANVLTGGNGNDTLTGNAGNDQLSGGAGADTLSGGAGNDIIVVGAAADHGAGEVIDGGVGTDVLRFTSTTGGETLVLEAGVTGVEQVVIGSAAGLTTGTTDLNLNASAVGTGLTLIGNAGANVLTGTSGNDILSGGAGNDTLDGGAGADRMAGGLGDDSYVVDAATDVVTEATNAGTDTVSASVNHTLGANVENLTLAGGDLNGTGNTLNNVIVGTNGTNILSGLAGNDILDGGDGADQLLGGIGNDTLDGGVGQDSVIGGLGDDRIVMLVTSGNVDDADGEAGNDTLALSGVVGGTGLVVVDFSASDQVTDIGGVADSTLVQNNFENLDASGMTGAVNVTGSAGNNSLIGSDGDDILDGGSGNDTLNGGAGDDTLVGGAGNDTYVVDSVGDVVDEALSGTAGGVDLVQSAITFTLATHGNVERLTLTGGVNRDGTGNALNNVLIGNSGNNVLSGDDGNDQLFGGAGGDTLNGEAGNDILNGEAGNDTLDGGIGTDTMAGGLGDDAYVVDAATEIVIEALNAGTDSVSASVNHTLRANVEYLTLTGGALNGTGNNLNNVIAGTNGNNVLTGLAGNDTMDGGDGDDVLNGGAGVDSQQGGNGHDVFLIGSPVEFAAGETIDGGADTDTLRYIGAAGILTLTNLVTNLEQVQIANAVGGTTGTAAVNINAVAVGNSLTIIGNNGANVLTGTAFVDTLTGNGGNDRLDGGTGDDTMSGGAGNDTYVVDGVGDVVDEALSGAAGGVDVVQSAITFTLATHGNVEHLTLLGSALDGTGNALNNTLTGNSADNILTGAAGNDTLTGNGGFDTLDGGAGADRMAGGLGNDTYVIDNASDTVTEALNAGTDLVQATVSKILGANVEHLTLQGSSHLNGTGNSLANELTGNSGNNVLAGLVGDDDLDGGDGNDTLDGGLGEDEVNGGAGDDRITMLVTAGNADTIDAGADNDTLVLSGVAPGTRAVVVDLSQADQVVSIGGVAEVLGQSNFEHLNAARLSGFVTVTGSAGNNTLIGSSGNDSLDGVAGDDTMSGGRGNDSYTVDSVSDVVTEAASAGIDKVFSSVDYTLSANVENLELTGVADRNGTGNTLANILIGNSGVNILTGGLGNDTYVVQNDTDSVVEALNAGTDSVQSTAATFTLGAHVELLTLLGTGDLEGIGNNLNNILTGNSGDNVLTGAAGNDTLTGNAGNDTLDGGAGADRMAGGLGDDTYVIDSASDTVTEALNAGTDLLQATVSKVLGANVEHLTLLGSAHLNGTGNALANILIGNSGNNRLTGMAGNDQLDGGDGDDILDGGAGVDTLVGGLGNDTYVIDNLQDTLVELAGAGTDTVQINGSVDLNVGAFTEIEHIVLSGTGAFNATGDNGDNSLTGNSAANILTGNGGNDTLNGGAGNDQLIGGLGDDLLNGGTGADSMTGGLGNDTYVIDNLGDTITELAGQGTDQVQANRTIDLEAVPFTEIEHVVLTGSAAINATGDSGDNSLTGNSGANILNGGLGDDTLAGLGGNDTYVVDSPGDTVSETLSGVAGGIDRVESAVSFLLGANIENLTLTGSGAINGIGNGLNNRLIGNSGANVFTGGDGNDSYVVGAGDTVNEAANEGLDTVESSVDFTLGTNIENLTLIGTSSIDAIGNDLNNVLTGNSGSNLLTGGLGNDTYVVQNSSDVVTEALNAGTDTVVSSLSYILGANLEHLTLTGTSGINGTGNALNNTIIGNGAANVFDGGAGNDTLNGGLGNDTYRFGAGDGQDQVSDTGGTTDRVLFDSVLDSTDLVISRDVADLRIRIGNTSDWMTIAGWYASSANRTERIEIANVNGEVLLGTQVDQLIQAMATFTQRTGQSWESMSAGGGSALQQTEYQGIIAASWE